MADPADRPLVLGDHTLESRLLVGTGKYASFEIMKEALETSGTRCVTVAIRRVSLDGPDRPSSGASLLDHIDRTRYTILPNTAGCFDAKSAIRTAELSRELLATKLVKLEVLGDKDSLYPDVRQTIAAAQTLVRDGFDVMVYTSDDPIVARELEAIGCVAIMPLASLIGSGMGILNPWNLRLILEQAKVPVLVDAGVGTASDAAVAMELGCAGVLMNTAIALAREPVRMAHAMKLAVEAGREAFLAGRMPRKLYSGAPSSPTTGLIG